jgi:hypothetical protein
MRHEFGQMTVSGCCDQPEFAKKVKLHPLRLGKMIVHPVPLSLGRSYSLCFDDIGIQTADVLLANQGTFVCSWRDWFDWHKISLTSENVPASSGGHVEADASIFAIH